MSQFIVTCLNPYRKPDCKLGRIINTEDFKHLARKVILITFVTALGLVLGPFYLKAIVQFSDVHI